MDNNFNNGAHDAPPPPPPPPPTSSTGPQHVRQNTGPSVIFVNYSFTFHPTSAAQNGSATPEASETAEQASDSDRRRPFQGSFFYTVPAGMATTGNAGPRAGMQGFNPFQEPPKPHASKAAIDALVNVDLSTIAETDRTCPICFEPYCDSKCDHSDRLMDAAESENVQSEPIELASDSEHTHSSTAAERTSSTEQPPLSAELEQEDKHVPLQMPCGHIFGKTCLKEWLSSSTTCPLCRTAIEAEPQAAQQFSFSAPESLPFILGPLFNFFHVARQPRETQNSPQQEEIHSSQSADTTASTSEADLSHQSDRMATESESSTIGTQIDSADRRAPVAGTYSVRHHPYLRRSAPTSSTVLPVEPGTSSRNNSSSQDTLGENLSLESVLSRPDLQCGSAPMGLCEHTGAFIRLHCGHGYHESCLRTSMRLHGDVDIPNFRDPHDVSSADPSVPRASREVWCMRCRRYREVDL
ncbi:uncharacterized protein V1516DRAFT_676015 [Lipomyces oligophaga]|uniref:uncharacterized protein n=1 Tax=Lipomyces oligophaga TaxID=45792 RepID=UPI0034CE4B00